MKRYPAFLFFLVIEYPYFLVFILSVKNIIVMKKDLFLHLYAVFPSIFLSLYETEIITRNFDYPLPFPFVNSRVFFCYDHEVEIQFYSDPS